MASSERSWSLSLLPPEIIEEIFYKTPADALVRSKPTCKKWYALITDERFIYQHLRRSRERPQERFIRIYDKVQIMDPVTRTSSVSPIPHELLLYPYDIDTLVHTLMVHCDGLMLVCYQRWGYTNRRILANIALWNPLLKTVRWVEQAAGSITSYAYYGIGYKIDGKYKLVRFTCRPLEVVEIYEFETSSWRTVSVKVDVDVEMTCKCVAVKGNMYWVAYRRWKNDEKFISVFDFSDETFKDICLCPPSYGRTSHHLSCFGGDSLSLLKQDEASKKIEVWVSSKLGGDGDVSFSKYFSLCGPHLPALRVRDGEYYRCNPVYCFVEPKSVIVWCVEAEGKGTGKACSCSTLYEIDKDGVKDRRETERSYMHDYSNAFVCGYVYVPSMIPLP